MKKRILTILLALALLCSLGGAALGSNAFTKAALSYEGVTVLLDGKTLVLTDADGAGVEPFLMNDTNYLPVRALGNALGLDVGWDDATSTVTLTSGFEPKNGAGEPLKSVRTVTAELIYRDVKIILDGTELIPKDVEGNVVEPFIINGTTYLPLRAIGNALGLGVDWDDATKTVILTSGGQAPGSGTGDTPAGHGGVTYRTESVSTSAGTVSAHILTVDTRDPAVNITPGVTGGKLRTTASVADIVAEAGYPLAVITGNFMDEKTEYIPIGNIMIDGELIFTGGGISSIGIMEDGSLICGRPDIRVKVVPENGEFPQWSGTGVNIPEGEIAPNLSALYTPSWGASFKALPGGTILSASGGAVTEFRTAAAGEEIPIPADGFVLIMTDEFLTYTNDKYRAAVPGERVHLEYFLNNEDGDGAFTADNLNGVKHMFSGGPRLVRHGEICTDLEWQFSEARFTTVSTSRTCAGITADGKLLLVSSSGTVQAMREMMLALGCVEAINLDGGASTALYYNGQTLVPEGRKLANTLRIYYAG